VQQSEFIRIPKDRIGALIGPKGLTKKEIEQSLKVRLAIDSETGEVEVIRLEKTPAVNLLTALNVIKAIGRGFSWEKAGSLLNENVFFELIDLRELFGKSEKKIHRKKARIIGSEGKAREKIEIATGVFISVYGHSIGLIGNLEALEKARQVIEALLAGKRHSTAFKLLGGEKEFEEWEI